MIKPPVVEPGDEVTTLGWVFGSPVVVKGKTWLPLFEMGIWGFMSWVAGKRRPERSIWARLGIGALTTPIVAGSEWCHNFTHAAAARLVGKPMDALRITWGTPLIVYYDIEDETVTPHQHIIRALGGPVFNALALPFVLLFRQLVSPHSITREIVDAALSANAFLLAVALLPLPHIDGGPILKWSLVARGNTPAEADLIVRKVDGVLGVGLGVGSAVTMKKKRWLLGAFMATLSVTALGIAFGLLKEK